MPLMKQASAEPLTSGALVLDLGDLRRQAAEIVEKAQREADGIVAAARAEAQGLIDSADEKGFAQGLERGLTQGREQGRTDGRDEAVREFGERLEKLADSWSGALERWDADFGAMLLAAREDVLRFAFAMARKIVLRALERDATIVQDQVAETLAILCRPSSVVIAINPQDRGLVEEILPQLMSRIAGCRHAEVRDDASITRGGCIVRTAGGMVDATIEKQVDRIALALLPPERPRDDDGGRDGANR